jgi:hypothetical protein
VIQLQLTAWAAGSVSRSVTRADICKWIKDLKPFMWTRIADQILEAIARHCERISDSGHY